MKAVTKDLAKSSNVWPKLKRHSTFHDTREANLSCACSFEGALTQIESSGYFEPSARLPDLRGFHQMRSHVNAKTFLRSIEISYWLNHLKVVREIVHNALNND